MRPFLVFVLSCAFVPTGVSEEVSGWLSNLPAARDYVQKRASSYDRSGGNFDLRRLPAGETLTLLDDSGPGIITHIWITLTNDDPSHLKALVLRMYWDGETSPSVETPLGDFFGLGLGEYFLYHSIPLAVGPERALNCFFPMPFNKSARITLSTKVISRFTPCSSTLTISLIRVPYPETCFISMPNTDRRLLHTA